MGSTQSHTNTPPQPSVGFAMGMADYLPQELTEFVLSDGVNTLGQQQNTDSTQVLEKDMFILDSGEVKEFHYEETRLSIESAPKDIVPVLTPSSCAHSDLLADCFGPDSGQLPPGVKPDFNINDIRFIGPLGEERHGIVPVMALVLPKKYHSEQTHFVLTEDAGKMFEEIVPKEDFLSIVTEAVKQDHFSLPTAVLAEIIEQVSAEFKRIAGNFPKMIVTILNDESAAELPAGILAALKTLFFPDSLKNRKMEELDDCQDRIAMRVLKAVFCYITDWRLRFCKNSKETYFLSYGLEKGLAYFPLISVNSWITFSNVQDCLSYERAVERINQIKVEMVTVSLEDGWYGTTGILIGKQTAVFAFLGAFVSPHLTAGKVCQEYVRCSKLIDAMGINTSGTTVHYTLMRLIMNLHFPVPGGISPSESALADPKTFLQMISCLSILRFESVAPEQIETVRDFMISAVEDALKVSQKKLIHYMYTPSTKGLVDQRTQRLENRGQMSNSPAERGSNFQNSALVQNKEGQPQTQAPQTTPQSNQPPKTGQPSSLLQGVTQPPKSPLFFVGDRPPQSSPPPPTSPLQGMSPPTQGAEKPPQSQAQPQDQQQHPAASPPSSLQFARSVGQSSYLSAGRQDMRTQLSASAAGQYAPPSNKSQPAASRTSAEALSLINSWGPTK